MTAPALRDNLFRDSSLIVSRILISCHGPRDSNKYIADLSQLYETNFWIYTEIESYLRTESSKNLSLTHFVNANRQFVVEHSPQHNADLQQFWAEALNTSSEKIGVRLVQKRVKPDWKLIAEEVCALTEG